MVVRRNDSRRRRIVVDPNLQPALLDDLSAAGENMAPPRKSNLYSDGAQRRHQSKTTDLIPKRPWMVALLVICLLLVVAGLNLLHHYRQGWGAWIGDEGVAAFSLSGRSTLAGWFSSLLLVVSGFASLQIYALRQHRRDDYRGSYRLWVWMAAVLLLASVNCVVDLSSIVKNLSLHLGQGSISNSPMTWLIVKLILLTLLVSRGLYEIRESNTAFALVVLVWVAYGGAAFLQIPWSDAIISRLDGVDQSMLQGNCLIFGSIAVLLGQLFFARFVYLQALGLIEQKQKVKVKVKAKPKSGKVNKSGRKTAATEGDESSQADGTTLEKSSQKNQTKKSAAKKGAATKSAAPDSTDKFESLKIADSGQSATAPEGLDEDDSREAKSRLKVQGRSQIGVDKKEDDSDMADQSEVSKSIFNLSKSQQRKQKKDQRQDRRAA